LRIVVLAVKVLLVVCFFMVVRWSWPRFRYDQLMALGWKIMLPLGLVNFVAIAALDQWMMIKGLSGGVWTVVFAVAAWTAGLLALIVAFALAPRLADNRRRVRMSAVQVHSTPS
jgi:NADH-quinone oxidoreductase subunit H